MVENAPSAIDLQEFQFKLHSKLKIFDNSDYFQFKNSYNLIATASRYGLVFVGSPNATLEVIPLKSIECCSLKKVESTNFSKRSVALPAAPSHLAVNCDQTLLSVISYKNDCPTAIIYNVTSFFTQNVDIVIEIRVSATPGIQVCEASWNPAIPGCLTACKADGSLGVYNINQNGVDINELPVAAAARSFCWSPKGKQLVVGSTNGSLTQYKPDLRAVKVIPPPDLGDTPLSVLSVFWVSNYQFVAVYNKNNADAESRPSVMVVNAPKVGATTYINYDDICYSYGGLRGPQYYISHQPTWGVMLFASANSMELGVLGLSDPTPDPALWVQWNQPDSARAELPLSATHSETFPVGLAFDTGVQLQLPWGENQQLPPMPFVYMLSHHGVLCAFSVINVKQGVPCVCHPPEKVDIVAGVFQEKQNVMSVVSGVAQTVATTMHQIGVQTMQQQSTMTLQAKQPASLTNAPTFGSITSNAPTFGSTSTAAFGSLAGKHGTTFDGAASIDALVTGSAPAVSASVSVPIATSTPPGLPISAPIFDSAAGGQPSSFGIIATVATSAASASSGFGFNPPTSAVSNADGLLPIGTSAKSSSFNLFTGTAAGPAKSVSATVAPDTVSNLFSGVSSHSAAVAISGGGLTSNMFGTVSKSAPMFNVGNNTSSTPNVAITPVVTHQQYTPPPSKPLLSTPKPDITNVPQPQNQSITQTTINETVITDQVIQSMIKEEMKNFQSELQELFNRCKTISLDVGTEDEKTNLVLTTESLLEFYKELQDTTDSQLAEVHYLKQALMQSFAWYEDTKARHRRYTDPNFSSLLQVQELDPISEKQIADIKHVIYYIEAQLKEVDGFLDNQWADFQDSCKQHVKGKLQIPTLEPIYQSMVRQNAILEKQKYLLKDIAARIKVRNKKTAAYPNIMNVTLTNARNNEIDEEFRKLKIDNVDPFSLRYDKVLAQHNKFTDNKQSKLCSFFTNRNVVHISPKKPKFINSLLNTPSKLSMYTPPGVQRNLAQAFNKMDVSFNNSPAVEANLSASNLFSFTLLDSASSTKVNTPPKPASNLLDSTPKPVTQAAPAPSKPSNFFNISATTASSGVFNFTAVSTATTQSKPVSFGSGDMSTQLMFAGAATKFTTQPAKPSESKKLADVVVIKPSVQKTLAEPMNQTFNFTPSQAKIAAHPKQVANLFGDSSTLATSAKPVNSTQFGPRDSVGPGFNFGSALSLGQQSTPKPKSPEGLSIAQILSTTTTAATVAKPAATVAKPAASVAISTASVFAKAQAAFTTAGSTTQTSTPVISTATVAKPEPAASTASIFGGLSLDKSINSGSFFGQASISTSAATGNIFGSVPAVPTAISGSLFSAKPAAQPEKLTTQPEKPAASIASPSVATSPTGSTGFSFTQVAAASNEAAKPAANIFGGATTASEASKPATNVFGATAACNEAAKSAANIFGGAATASEASKPATTVFEGAAASNEATKPVTNLFGAAISEAPVTKVVGSGIVTSAAANIFGGAAATSEMAKLVTNAAATSEATQPATNVFAGTPANVFGKSIASTPPSPSIFAAASSTASGFSFLQPASSAATSTATTVANTVGVTITPVQKPAEPPVKSTVAVSSAASIFGAPVTQSSFGFGALAATTASNSNNAFSFGNFTVSALSPSTAATPAAVTATTSSTGFSFALSATTSTTTVTTTNASAFGGQSQSVFGKPAAATTSTSSLMGQTICSPSFSQSQGGSMFGSSTGNIFAQKSSTPAANTGSIFGQSSGGSLFGQTSTAATSASSTSIFGQAQTSNPFASPATTQTSGGSVFGQTSAFGTPSTTSSIFGQSSFGSPAATSASGSFSFTQNTGSFGQSGGSIFAAKPAFGAAPAFGQAPAFGAPPAFGGSPATGGSVFGSPQASNNAGSGFGSSAGFGQKPAFGSPPSFGQSAFGSPPAFGSSPGFGTPQRVFGGAASPSTGTFGASVQENSTFANLATQSTIGFGNLVQNQPVQQQPQQPPPQFSGGAQFSSWR